MLLKLTDNALVIPHPDSAVSNQSGTAIEDVNMNAEKYRLHKFLLHFLDNQIEKKYRQTTVDSTINFVRVAWIMVILFGSIFSILDKPFFGPQAALVITSRIILLSLAGAMLAFSWWHPIRPYLVWSSTLFIILVGTFCTIQTALSPPGVFSPYIMGVVLSFCGIFCTVGIGFTYSIFALMGSMVIFELLIGVIVPTNAFIFLIYNFFFISFMLAFTFLAYYTEFVSRKRYVVSAQMLDSIEKSQTLQGLLPICSSCKQIRDDKGYWNQMEIYLSRHADVIFSHSICPACIKKIYPEIEYAKAKTT